MNNALYQAIKEGIIEEDYKKLSNVEDVPHEFSPQFLKEINKLITIQKKVYYPLIKTTTRRIITILVASLIMGSVLVASCEPLRDWFVGLFITANAENTDIVFAEDLINQSNLTANDNLMAPTKIPDGFKQSNVISDEYTHIIRYSSENKTIEFTRNNLSLGISIDTNDLPPEEIEIKGNEGYLSIKDDTSILIWIDDNFVYTIVGNLSRNDIISMAESVGNDENIKK